MVVRQNVHGGNLAHITVGHSGPSHSHRGRVTLSHCAFVPTGCHCEQQHKTSHTQVPPNSGDASTDPVGKGRNGLTDCDQPAMHNISTSEKDSNPTGLGVT